MRSLKLMTLHRFKLGDVAFEPFDQSTMSKMPFIRFLLEDI